MSRTNENRLNKQLQIGGRIMAPLSHFTARYDEIKSRQNRHRCDINEIGQMMDANFYTPDDMREHGAAVFMTALKYAVDSKNNRELCAHVASMMSMVIPNLKYYLFDVLEEKNIKIRIVKLPSQAKENQVDMISVYPKDWPSVLIVFGCCIMLLFEDINPQNYINLMSNRISEMRAKVGCDPGNPMEFPFPLEKAKAIRSMLGSSRELKAEVISMIIVLAGKSKSIGSLTNYLMDILSWSELREFTFIHDNLLLTKSPVLLDPRLKLELVHLNEAFQAISSHGIPQFFRYLGSKGDQYKLERSRFPIIMAVAEELKRRAEDNSDEESDDTDQNFISTMPQRAIVEELVATHLDYMANEGVTNVTQTYQVSDFD